MLTLIMTGLVAALSSSVATTLINNRHNVPKRNIEIDKTAAEIAQVFQTTAGELVDDLRDRLQELRETNAELHTQVTELRKEVAELRTGVALLHSQLEDHGIPPVFPMMPPTL